MADFFAQLGVWNWFILAAVLMALELTAPGVFLIWFGAAAFVVGLIALAIDLSWQTQGLLFAIAATLAVLIGRRITRKQHPDASNQFLNKRSQGLVGRVATLETSIIDGWGTIKIDDTVWRVAGPNLEAGQHVRVTKADGASLTVEAA